GRCARSTAAGPARMAYQQGPVTRRLDAHMPAHTGECEVIGDDIGGMCVHLAARVCGLAGPGEVLVSRTVKDLVVGSGIEFSGHGVHELKGVPGEWELFLVT